MYSLILRYRRSREFWVEFDETVRCYGGVCRVVEDPWLRAGCPFLLLYYFKIRRILPARAAAVREAVKAVFGFDPEAVECGGG